MPLAHPAATPGPAVAALPLLLLITMILLHQYHHTMKTISHWVPAGFCAFISLIALFGSISPSDSGWWRPAFFAFLPMCFFFVGSVTTKMYRELRELRQRITEMEQKERVKS